MSSLLTMGLFCSLGVMVFSKFKLLSWLVLVEVLGMVLLLNYFLLVGGFSIESVEVGVFFLWLFICESCLLVTFYILYIREFNFNGVWGSTL